MGSEPAPMSCPCEAGRGLFPGTGLLRQSHVKRASGGPSVDRRVPTSSAAGRNPVKEARVRASLT